MLRFARRAGINRESFLTPMGPLQAGEGTLEEIHFETACVDSYVRKQAQKQTGNVYFCGLAHHSITLPDAFSVENDID